MQNKNLFGQLSDAEFMAQYPDAQITQAGGKRTAITLFGKQTVNYWVQYSDGSWTNYDCKTKP